MHMNYLVIQRKSEVSLFQRKFKKNYQKAGLAELHKVL